MKRGVTLVELLVVIAIMLILGGAILKAYESVFKKTAESATVLKSEMDIQLSTVYLLKDLESIGFGVDRSRFSAGTECNFSDFLNENRAVSICTTGGYSIFFLSLAAREQEGSGCWGVTDFNGCLDMSRAKNRLGEECVVVNDKNKYIFMDVNKSTIDPESGCVNSGCPSGFKCLPNLVVFYRDDHNYPGDFAARYCFGPSTNCSPGGDIPRECAPGTGVLYKEINGSSPQPVISCVREFRVFYGIASGSGVTYTTTPPASVENLNSIRLCLIFQVGKRRDNVIANPPNLSLDCGGPVTYTVEQQYYRWDVLEVNIPVRNLQ